MNMQHEEIPAGLGNQVKGLPNGWRWVYGAGHGFNGRHAVYMYNTELSLPVRQVQAIQKGGNFKDILKKTINRRDIILAIHNDDVWQKRNWRRVDFQFSTGAYGFVQSLADTTLLFITATGTLWEYYKGKKSTGTGETETRTIGGYRQASFYKNNQFFYEDVFVPAYEMFEHIDFFTVCYEV